MLDALDMGVVLHAHLSNITSESTVVRPSFMPVEHAYGRPVSTPLITRRSRT